MKPYELSTETIRDIFEWDVNTWAQSLEIWEPELMNAKTNVQRPRILDIGARNGGTSLYFALNGCEVVCSDIRGIVPAAEELHKKYGVADQVSYQQIDATEIPFEDESFDGVCVKSVLGGVYYHKQESGLKQAAAEIYRVLKPGGKFFLAENLFATSFHDFLRKSFNKHRGKVNPWTYPKFDEIAKIVDAYSQQNWNTKGVFSLFGRNESQRALLNKVDGFANVVTPQSKRYLYYGVFTK